MDRLNASVAANWNDPDWRERMNEELKSTVYSHPDSPASADRLLCTLEGCTDLANQTPNKDGVAYCMRHMSDIETRARRLSARLAVDQLSEIAKGLQ